MSDNKHSPTIRYPEQELVNFRIVIEDKLKKSNMELESHLSSMKEMGNKGKGDHMDNSAVQADLELLQTMVHREKKYINDLNNALLRIQNGVYGVCVITGNLIDKKRLLAVPTTTKSIASKKSISSNQENPIKTRKVTPKLGAKNIISKKLTKKDNNKVAEDFDLEEYLENDNFQVDEKELDIIAKEDHSAEE